MQNLLTVSNYLIIGLISIVQCILAHGPSYPPGISPTFYQAPKVHLGKVGQGKAPLSVNAKRINKPHAGEPKLPNSGFVKNTVSDIPAEPDDDSNEEGFQTYPPGVPHNIYEQQVYEEVEDEHSEENNHEENEVDSDVHETEPKLEAEEHVNNNQIVEEKVSIQNRTPSILLPSHDMNKSEKEHLQKHMEIPLDTSEMSPYELAFHYFKVHDADANQKLDGLELIHFLMHYVEHEDKQPPRIYSDQELMDTIDHVLAQDDLDKDGYISYAEFKISYGGSDK